jgi:hypothetical protein
MIITEIVREKAEHHIGTNPSPMAVIARRLALAEGKTMHDLVDIHINAMTPLQLLHAISDAIETLREEGRL